MSNLYKAGLVAALFALLTACSGSDDSGHDHDGDADHAHEAAADGHAHAHDGDGNDQPHRGDAHAAPETEAFYGDEADAPEETEDALDVDAAGGGEDHHHDGERHEHQH